MTDTDAQSIYEIELDLRTALFHLQDSTNFAQDLARVMSMVDALLSLLYAANNSLVSLEFDYLGDPPLDTPVDGIVHGIRMDARGTFWQGANIVDIDAWRPAEFDRQQPIQVEAA